MNKAALVESIRGIILKAEAVEDNTKVLHYKRVEKLVEAAFDELLQVLAKKDDGELESNFVKDYYNQVLSQASGMQYVELPASIASLPNGKGVWYVKPTGSSEHYVQSTRNSTSLFRHIPVGDCINDSFYRIGNSPSGLPAIIFQHIGESERRSVRAIDYGIIRKFSGYSDTDDVPVPNDSYSFIIEKVMAWLGKRYTDLQNNNQ